MANSFINIGNYGFHASNDNIEAIQICLINYIEEKKLDKSEWLNKYKNELALQCHFNITTLSLEEYLTTDTKKNVLINICKTIYEKINTDPNYFTSSNLQKFRRRTYEILIETKQVSFDSKEKFESMINYINWLENDVRLYLEDYSLYFNLLIKLLASELTFTFNNWINDYK